MPLTSPCVGVLYVCVCVVKVFACRVHFNLQHILMLYVCCTANNFILIHFWLRVVFERVAELGCVTF